MRALKMLPDGAKSALVNDAGLLDSSPKQVLELNELAQERHSWIRRRHNGSFRINGFSAGCGCELCGMLVPKDSSEYPHRRLPRSFYHVQLRHHSVPRVVQLIPKTVIPDDRLNRHAEISPILRQVGLQELDLRVEAAQSAIDRLPRKLPALGCAPPDVRPPSPAAPRSPPPPPPHPPECCASLARTTRPRTAKRPTARQSAAE
jgi:hypothetical protein